MENVVWCRDELGSLAVCSLLWSDRWNKQADFVLEGHRSIVNQVRYNADNCLIISSGVEKIIKVSL